jgi:hypothetical protein
MAETWPASLPADPRREGYKPPRAGKNVLSSQTDGGRPKRRRLFTAVPAFVEISWRWSVSDWETYWLPFLHTTLADGALAFTWTEPLTGEEYEAHIVDGAQGVDTAMGPGHNVIVSVRLEVI